MKLRTQLLLINTASLALLVGAVVYSYHRMFLNYDQARLLTFVSLGAGVLSTVAYWFMTIPVTRSLKGLVHIAEGVRDGMYSTTTESTSGPIEVQKLMHSIFEMQERIHDHFRQLEAMEVMRRELVANVSHDLRTPITAIQSYVEALVDGVIDNPDTAQKYMQTIHRESRRLSALIDDLFELSRLEAGQQKFEPSLVHLDQLVIESLESHALRIKDKSLDVLVHIESAIPPLLVMPDKIARVLVNLLDNAIRHSPIQAAIEVRVYIPARENHVLVVIEDEGEGIQDEDAKRIFERFYRVDKSRSRNSGGSGLGLAIARSLVELHGGTIGVNSRTAGSRHGSAFWFTLPINSTC